ncbi:MAG: IS66 family transposase zinc-finger binding domain-containing protein [Flavonifractor plautii]
MKKKTYGSSSEHTQEELMDRLSFVFNEAEAWQDAEKKAREATTVAEHTWEKRSSRVEEVLPEDVPVEVVEHYPDEAVQVCPECGSQMSVLGKEVRRSLVMIPAQVKIREDVYYAYSASAAKREHRNPSCKGKKSPAVIPGSYVPGGDCLHHPQGPLLPLMRQFALWYRSL